MSKKKPTLSWIPVRLFPLVLREKSCTIEEWLDKASEYGLDAVEIYAPFFDFTPEMRETISNKLDAYNLKVSMVTTSPDFTNPNKDVRKSEIATAKRAIDDAANVGATAIRCTTGQAHPRLSLEDGLDRVASGMIELSEYGADKGVLIAMENHFRDRMVAELPDFAQRKDVFFKLYERLEPTSVMVNLDCSNPLMVDENALDILEVVKDKIVSVHASDRMRGAYQHSSIGDGEVDYPAILSRLAELDYSGWISIEDGQPNGNEGFLKSLSFMRQSIDRYWS